MKYYKILNENECHNGFVYKTGLNVDTVPFDPSGSCKPGGLYFCSENILTFLYIGPHLREVTLPEDAQVYEDPDNMIRKWKADKIILSERQKITYDVVKRLIKEGADVNSGYALANTYRQRKHDIVSLLLRNGAVPTLSYIQAVCEHDDIPSLKRVYNRLSQCDKEHSFRYACKAGAKYLVKFLLQKDPALAEAVYECTETLKDVIDRRHLDVLDLIYRRPIYTDGWNYGSIWTFGLLQDLMDRGYKVIISDDYRCSLILEKK